MKKVYTILTVIVLTFSLGYVNVNAEPPSGSCSVTRYSQQKSNWCWAACSKMIGHYHGKNKTQGQIVTHVKGSEVNEAASDSEMVKALKYANGNAYTVTNHNKTISYDNVQNYISRGFPFVVKISWASGGGHAEVLSSYDVNHKVTLIDPWSNRENRKYLFSDLVNGTYLFNSKGTYVNTFTVTN